MQPKIWLLLKNPQTKSNKRLDKICIRRYTPSVRVFKNKWFNRFAAKEGLTDAELLAVVADLEVGRFDADLGGGVFKQRIARAGGGKSGGYRSIIFFRSNERAFFVYGFAKSDRANISQDEKQLFRESAKDAFAKTDAQLKKQLDNGTYVEIEVEAKNAKEVQDHETTVQK
jgi:hypothetical protein